MVHTYRFNMLLPPGFGAFHGANDPELFPTEVLVTYDTELVQHNDDLMRFAWHLLIQISLHGALSDGILDNIQVNLPVLQQYLQSLHEETLSIWVGTHSSLTVYILGTDMIQENIWIVLGQ